MVGVLQTLPAMANQGRHQYVALLPDIPEYRSLDSPNLRVVLTRRSGNILVREWWLNNRVGEICRQEKADALLCLGNFAPHHPPVPTVIRLQNAYYVYQDARACRGLTLRERLIVRYGREHFRHLAGNVNVIVQTEVMRQHLLSQSPISPSRVMVIRSRGASFPEFPRRCAAPRNDTFSPFTFLAVALCTPNKNLGVLVEAVKRLRTMTQCRFRCLLTIDPTQHPTARELLARIKREDVGDLLVNIGSLAPEQLARAYATADAFILPTLLESFCRPYDEAMHFDLPILTSDRDFALERCQNAAIYFDPLDAGSVARSMASVMGDADLRQRLVANGQRIVAQAPTWDENAARLVEVLERTARENQGLRADGRGQIPPSADVRTLFNHKARGWRSKYVPHGKLHSRVEQFTARLAELCPAPARILDLGCGTGEIAAALSQMGYPVTACDFAEEMMAVARRNYARTPVDWVGLEPEWKALPFADASFDGIVVSSVFEYLDDVPRVAAELSRVLRPEGVLLLTVPNPCNSVRKLEGRLRSMRMVQQVSSALGRVQRIGSYAAYLRLSRNRFAAQGWQSVLSAAHFAPLDQRDFSPEAWRRQARAPLVLLAVKRVAVGDNGQFDAEETLCRPLAM